MAPRVERKLAAILAADVVGYSRLVGADEAGTIARLKALRKEFIEPLIAEYRGRVVKLTGDGALVEFASAVDAVECAVAIQNGVAEREAAEPEDRRIQFRIGINVGDIIVEDGDILGDGVNVAARLEGLAEPGGICVARNVHDQIKAKLALPFEPMGAAPGQEHRRAGRGLARRARRVVHRREGDGSAPRAGCVAAGVACAARARRRWRLVVAAEPGRWQFWRGRAGAAMPAGPRSPCCRSTTWAATPAEERFADGITEDIITDLARFRDLRRDRPQLDLRLQGTSPSTSARSARI